MIPMTQPVPSGHPVARIAGRTVTREEISSRYAPPTGRSAHDWEQMRLDQILAESLYAAAIERTGVAVSANLLTHDVEFGSITDEVVTATVHRDRKWMLAALAVFDGASVESAYTDQLAGLEGNSGRSRETFGRFVSMFDSRDAIVKSFDGITTDSVRQSIIAGIRQKFAREHLMNYLVTRARLAGVPLEDFAAHFWDEVFCATQVKIVDQEFRLISWRELSWDAIHNRTR